MLASTFKIPDKTISGFLLARLRREWALVAAIVLFIGQAWVIGRTAHSGTTDPITWSAVFTWIERDWPEVPQMSTRELAERMTAGNESALLIDVRTREEYEVSHLPGAIWAETPTQIASAVSRASDRQPVVLYCSVGVRSSKAAAQLMRSGRTNVFNLKGSIFEWANEDRPLTANGRPAHVVHPYNQRWGVLLDSRLHPTSVEQR
jgi:rhodanese-related sulfurtransferase